MKMNTHIPLALTTIVMMITITTITAMEESPSPIPSLDFIRTSCGTTLYPELCYTSLSRYSLAIKDSPAHLARLAVSLSLSHARRASAHFAALARRSRTEDYGPAAAAALRDCLSSFADAADEIRGSLRQIRHLGTALGGAADSEEDVRFGMSNVQTWMSAALTDQETCTDGFEGVSDGFVKADVFSRATVVKHHTSNALALVNAYARTFQP